MSENELIKLADDAKKLAAHIREHFPIKGQSLPPSGGPDGGCGDYTITLLAAKIMQLDMTLRATQDLYPILPTGLAPDRFDPKIIKELPKRPATQLLVGEKQINQSLAIRKIRNAFNEIANHYGFGLLAEGESVDEKPITEIDFTAVQSLEWGASKLLSATQTVKPKDSKSIETAKQAEEIVADKAQPALPDYLWHVGSNICEIRFRGEMIEHIGIINGVKYIANLLARPGQLIESQKLISDIKRLEFNCKRLAKSRIEPNGVAIEPDIMAEGMNGLENDNAPVYDAETENACRKQLEEIEIALPDANADGDQKKIDYLIDQKTEIEQYLKDGKNRLGKTRSIQKREKNKTQTIRNALNNVYDKIKNEKLVKHLKGAINSNGSQWLYQTGDPTIKWNF